MTEADVFNLRSLVDATTTVQSEAHGLSGSIDFTKVAGDGLITPDDFDANARGLSTIPFTAAVDNAGRLTSLVFDMPGDLSRTPAGRWTITISGYGEQMPQQKPAGPIKEMSASTHSL